MLSIDTLRGFDMLFIMGFSKLIAMICGLFPGGSDCWLATQMNHVKWDGLQFYDTVFPLFLFIAGMTFPFSYSKQKEQGHSQGKILWKVIRRCLILVFLGLAYSGLFNLNFAHLRIPSVLGRIGIAWMFAAILFMYVGRTGRIIIAGAILIGYWLLLALVPAPDALGAGPFTEEGNLVGYIDRILMPNHILLPNRFDPEGTLSTLPAIVTAMLGMFTGEFVKDSESGISGNGKTIRMLIAAACLLVVGLVWSQWFPVNKKLWTSSYVLVVGAYSVAMFALFYWVIDVKKWRGWTKFFQVIGMNSITIYMAMRIIDFSKITDFFLKGTAALMPDPWAKALLMAGKILICWLFLLFLYRKKVFIKV